MKKGAVSLAFIAALTLCPPLPNANPKLSKPHQEFLLQCGVSRTDIIIIPLLAKKVQAEISAAITHKDCQELARFKISREYYNQVRVLRKDIPLPPPEWDTVYLTDEEFEDFVHLVGGNPLYGGQ